jgi:hypothetical protein
MEGRQRGTTETKGNLMANDATNVSIDHESVNLNIEARSTGDTLCSLIQDACDIFDEQRQRAILGTIRQWLNEHPLKRTQTKTVGVSPVQHCRSLASEPPGAGAMPPAVRAAISQCESILASIGELPEPGWEFGESVGEKIRDILETIETRQHVTDGQQTAIDNMETGINAWLR